MSQPQHIDGVTVIVRRTTWMCVSLGEQATYHPLPVLQIAMATDAKQHNVPTGSQSAIVSDPVTNTQIVVLAWYGLQ